MSDQAIKNTPSLGGQPAAVTSRAAGLRGEDAACRYLCGKGYSILDRNVRIGRFEIDIIARTGDIVVFCEVKTARSRRFGHPSTWVTPDKKRRIAQAASEYLQANPIDGVSFRFDVIGLQSSGEFLTVNHIENAFRVPEDM